MKEKKERCKKTQKFPIIAMEDYVLVPFCAVVVKEKHETGKKQELGENFFWNFDQKYYLTKEQRQRYVSKKNCSSPCVFIQEK